MFLPVFLPPRRMHTIYKSTKCGIFYEGSGHFFHDPAPRRMHTIYESTSVGATIWHIIAVFT